jgi:hypothetical protein
LARPPQPHLKISATPADTNQVTVDPMPKPATSDLEAMTSTILTAVERQLTRYFSAMSQQAEAARKLAEESRDEIRRELDTRLPAIEELVQHASASAPAPVDEAQLARLNELEHALAALRSDTEQRIAEAISANDEAERQAARVGAVESTLDNIAVRTEEQRAANEAYQAALQTALEERLGEFANHQHWRMNDIEEKIAAIPTGIDAETMMEIRQTVRDDMERSFGAVHTRLDEIVNVNKRFDEQATAHVQQLNDTTSALTLRMDEGDERTAFVLEERLNALQVDLNASFESVGEQVTEHATTLLGKIDQAESRGVDRLLELEGRIAEDLGTKIANLDATIGRVAGGFDEAMIALNQRLLELENKLYEFDERIGVMAEELSKVDDAAMDEMRAEMSRAVGEATLVRIEFDRVVAATDQKIDKQTIRMSEIEGMLIDHMDVSTAVQLERLDELERQMALIEAPPGLAPTTARSVDESMASVMYGETDAAPPTESSRALPSMSLNPRPNPADTPPGAAQDSNNDDGSRETESTYSTH